MSMPILEITEQNEPKSEHNRDSPFLIRLVFEGTTESIKTLPKPRDDLKQELSWYFDQYAIDSPFDSARADKVRAQIENSRSNIFETLELARYDVGGVGKTTLWIDVMDNGCPTSKFHQVLWESLEGPTGVWKTWETVIVRRKVPDQHQERPSLAKDSLSFNVLLVVARKHDDEHFRVEGDIAYHNVAIPIVEAVEKMPNVRVDLAPPGTFRSFKEHIEAKPRGFYDVVHFDLHGKLSRTQARYDPKCRRLILKI
jgi:hypothetical protein